MKKLFVLVLGMMLMGQATFAQNDSSTVTEVQDIYIFIESKPLMPKRYLGDLRCSKVSPFKEEDIIPHMIKRAQKEYAGQEFNGLVFHSGTNLGRADVIQFANPPKTRRRSRSKEKPKDPRNKIAQVNNKNGLFIFIQSNPKAAFDLLGNVEAPAMLKSNEANVLIPEMVKLAKEKYPDADAIVFIIGSNLRSANAIKFK